MASEDAAAAADPVLVAVPAPVVAAEAVAVVTAAVPAPIPAPVPVAAAAVTLAAWLEGLRVLLLLLLRPASATVDGVAALFGDCCIASVETSALWTWLSDGIVRAGRCRVAAVPETAVPADLFPVPVPEEPVVPVAVMAVTAVAAVVPAFEFKAV